PFRVRLVPPEVVVPVSAFGDHRDPVIGVQSGAQFAGEGVEEFVAEAVQGLRVLVFDPGDLHFAGDVLEPEILVFGLLTRCQGCCAGTFFTHATHPSVCRPGIRPRPPELPGRRMARLPGGRVAAPQPRRPRCLLIPACRAASTGLSGVLSASEISTPMVVPATSTVVFSRGRNLQGMSTVRGGSEPVDPVPASVPPEPESSFSPEPVSSVSRESMLSVSPGGPVSERWPEDASATSSLWSGPGSGLLIGLVLDR